MMLFKYVTERAGRAILDSNTVGYARPADFNDPFELTVSYREDTPDPVRGLLAEIRHRTKTGAWRDAVAILCLTRAPLNPLMWAHYADGHRGFVLGFDVKTSGFADEATNLVPAHYGSVIYTNTRRPSPLLSQTPGRMSIAREYSFRPELGEKLQRLFLQKATHWAYEEEVRVVKCIAAPAAGEAVQAPPACQLSETTVHDRTLYLQQLPEGAVREVYFGLRNTAVKDPSFMRMLAAKHPKAAMSRCVLGHTTWNLEATPIAT